MEEKVKKGGGEAVKVGEVKRDNVEVSDEEKQLLESSYNSWEEGNSWLTSAASLVSFSS